MEVFYVRKSGTELYLCEINSVKCFLTRPIMLNNDKRVRFVTRGNAERFIRDVVKRGDFNGDGVNMVVDSSLDD